jgi:predicted TIM-barrel fold metal-dependent hydrolase
VASTASTSPAARRRITLPIIDADVHNAVPPDAMAALGPHLSTRWRGYLERFGARSLGEDVLVRVRPHTSRSDAWPPDGGPPGSDPTFAAEQLLDRHGIHAAVLNNMSGNWQPFIGGNQPDALSVELMQALNEWAQTAWLAADPRWYASICVPFEVPDAAAAEIERRRGSADCGRWVQVLLADRLERPVGHPKYWPILEAAAHHGLPIAFHPGGRGMNPITGSGWPSFYYEDHVGYPQAALSHLSSLIFQGAFDRWPDLRVVMVEGGYSWAVPFAWRLDSCWRLLRDEVPHLQRAPSEYVREHVWFTTQPIEEPVAPASLAAVVAQLERTGLGERLMFSSDYPHWDFDDPHVVLPRGLGDERRARIFAATAGALYGIPLP